MKYFVVTSTIRDGEYEYLQQSPVRALTEARAEQIIFNDNEAWTADDYREHSIDRVTEVTEEEYQVLSKYIY